MHTECYQLQCWALLTHAHRVLPATASHALPGPLLSQPEVPPSMVLLLPSLVSCLARTRESCQAPTTTWQLAYPLSSWEVFLCPIQDELTGHARQAASRSCIHSPFHYGRCVFIVGTMSHSGLLCPEWSHTKQGPGLCLNA